MENGEGLTMLDARGHRHAPMPAETNGFFRRRRNYVETILIFIFLALPWIRVGDGQALLLDIVHRKFEIFGLRFWSHDGPLIFFVLGCATLGLALFTALFGRAWCGWACPQTVFVDGIFRRIEVLVEGNYIERRRLEREGRKALGEKWRWFLKWILFVVTSSIISHSFLAYFVGSRELIEMMAQGAAENWNYFLLVTGMTGILCFNFGWFREQFCIIACPYGRFQSVLHDNQTVTVNYDTARGEPRKSGGDCVACNRCVQVCPTSIDIRNGIQLECIACTACIDACNEIMQKVKKAPNLIRYSSSTTEPVRWLRPRVLVYGILLLACAGGLATNIVQRSGFAVTLMRAKETPYQIIEKDKQKFVINHFKLHLLNQNNQPQKFVLTTPETWFANEIDLTSAQREFELAAVSDKEIHFFIIFPARILDSKGEFSTTLRIFGQVQSESVEKPLLLVGPNQ